MSTRLEVDDLELVEAVARHGSVGAAARELLVAQPSASRRLAALERRLGARLFERDTTGARPTGAGMELARRAAHLLAQLDELPDHTLASVNTTTLALGTIQALSPMVFSAVEIELGSVHLRPEVDHGPVLVQQVNRGTLDAAIITIAEQTVIPRGLQRTPVGESPLVVVLPEGASDLSAGPRPFAGQNVIYNTIDLFNEGAKQRLSTLGAIPRPGATIETTLRMARHHGCPALVPEFIARWYSAEGDRIIPSPVSGQVTLSLVNRPPQPDVLTRSLPSIVHRILSI